MLFKGGVGGANPDNWYLRSALLVPVSTSPAGTPSVTEPQPLPLPGPAPAGFAVVQLIRPEVAVQSVVPDIARTLGLLALGTFHERRGDQALLDTAPAAWGRVFGQQGNEQYSGGVRPDFSGTFAGFQTGLDLLRFGTWDGVRNLVGVSAGQARASGDVSGFVLGVEGAHAGTVDLSATSVGGYWTMLGWQGWYVDMVVQGDFIDGTPRSDRGIGANISGTNFTASIEGGLPIALGAGIAIEPQAQFIPGRVLEHRLRVAQCRQWPHRHPPERHIRQRRDDMDAVPEKRCLVAHGGRGRDRVRNQCAVNLGLYRTGGRSRRRRQWADHAVRERLRRSELLNRRR
jgi:autotransporter family porin